MSRKGMPVMESFFSSLKQELMHHERFVDRDEARSKMFDYIEVVLQPRTIAQWTGLPLTRTVRTDGGSILINLSEKSGVLHYVPFSS
jgi:putative transposase